MPRIIGAFYGDSAALQSDEMSSATLKMRCQRCGEQMEMRDPMPGGPWKPDQFWVCPACGRHFWTTYANAPKSDPPEPPAPKADAAPAKEAAGSPAP
jgi:rRNA maturation protein Nop10